MRCFAGFDLGGTHLKFGLVDETGEILYESQVDTPAKTPALLHTLRTLWNTLKSQEYGGITCVGFGFPGIFSHKEQKILQSPNYPDIDRFDLLPALSRFIDAPFFVNNDANMAAFGEFKRGAGQNTHSLVLLTIGTGVGSGIIFNGDIWQGVCGFGGEIGHTPVNPDGDRCSCGSQGCLETEVSAGKIIKNYKVFSGTNHPLTTKDIYRRAENYDEAARKALAEAGKYLGIGLATVINCLNPEKILLGGGVMKAGEYLIPPAVQEAAKRSFKASFECCSIERAMLGNKAGFTGAALWSWRQLNLN